MRLCSGGHGSVNSPSITWIIDLRQLVLVGGGLKITMSEITEPIDALPVVAEIQNIETEVLSCEIQNINVPLAPEDHLWPACRSSQRGNRFQFSAAR